MTNGIPFLYFDMCLLALVYSNFLFIYTSSCFCDCNMQ